MMAERELTAVLARYVHEVTSFWQVRSGLVQKRPCFTGRGKTWERGHTRWRCKVTHDHTRHHPETLFFGFLCVTSRMLTFLG